MADQDRLRVVAVALGNAALRIADVVRNVVPRRHLRARDEIALRELVDEPKVVPLLELTDGLVVVADLRAGAELLIIPLGRGVVDHDVARQVGRGAAVLERPARPGDRR